ncbi:MAG TPA: 4a-hydroxytetrahydrobiopterin dehydratase [Candidatus Nanoarchaeia archaeon]|nr:4a-hydroxytetrahydrobiopterin dehydratase [Candidatus Nanoarchaeia archaeon]
MELKDQKCDCNSKKVQKLTPEGIEALLQQVDGWKVDDNGLSIYKKMLFPDYMSGINFINEMARIAEEQNHHPDFFYTPKNNRLKVSISTYVINGLTENDFILAAKYDAIKR